MRVLFINPPGPNNIKMVREGRCMQRKGAWTSVWPPLSLALCAAVVREENVDVELIDCIVKGIEIDELKNKVTEFEPDLVVLNTATPSIENDIRIADEIKGVCQDTKIVAIGIHPTVLPEECFNMSANLDYIIRGEPEFTLRELVRFISQSDKFSINNVAGISFRNNNIIYHNPAREWLNIDELPFPAWDLVDPNDYIMPFHNVPFFLITTSRGCPYPCNFCADSAYYGKKLRKRSPEKLVDELVWAGKNFNVNEFLFWSESFTLDRSFVMAVCEKILRRHVQIKWVCNSRVDHVDKELLKTIKSAGCWMIGYGIESGNQNVLDMTKKGITIPQIRRAVKLAKDVDLEVTGHCILGLPGDTIETIQETVRFAIELDLDFVQFYCAVPFPGSELYQQAVENNWCNTNNWSLFEQNYSVLDYPHLSSSEIIELRRWAYRKFYLRPKVIFNIFRKLKKPTDITILVDMIKEFFTWI
jgi:radical SAM superfamily enzyme YgiQ (UPF0313 family)